MKGGWGAEGRTVVVGAGSVSTHVAVWSLVVCRVAWKDMGGMN